MTLTSYLIPCWDEAYSISTQAVCQQYITHTCRFRPRSDPRADPGSDPPEVGTSPKSTSLSRCEARSVKSRHKPLNEVSACITGGIQRRHGLPFDSARTSNCCINAGVTTSRVVAVVRSVVETNHSRVLQNTPMNRIGPKTASRAS